MEKNNVASEVFNMLVEENKSVVVLVYDFKNHIAHKFSTLTEKKTN